MLLPSADSAQAVAVIDRLREGTPLGQTFSSGVAIWDGTETSDELVARADTGLYAAKENGRARSELFDDTMRELSLARIAIERDLREALDRDQLYNVYQPIVHSQSGRIVALEALVRWAHPARGVVSPAEFIPVAERTGLIVEVGQRVLADACEQAASWRGAAVCGRWGAFKAR